MLAILTINMNAITKNLFKLKFVSAIFLFCSFVITGQSVEKSQLNLAKQYQKLAENGKPVLISTDLAFEQVNFFFSDALEQIEKDRLSKNLETGLSDALGKTATALQTEKDGAVREILTANYAYLLTALRLLLPAESEKLKAENARSTAVLISPDLRNIAEESKLVLAAGGLQKSPLLGYTEDYTQYTPRGRYASSEEQTRYFRTAIWLGRMGFYTEPNGGNGIDEKQAGILTARGAALIKTLGEFSAFTDYDKQLSALIGTSDDLTIAESAALIEKALGKKLAEAGFQEIIAAAPKIRALIKSEGRRPKILSTVAVEGTPNPTAIRLLGQRFTPDAYVFQNLTFSKVQDYTGGNDKTPFTLSVTADGRKVRGVPRVFDVLDAVGFVSAADQIKTGGDDLYANYAAQRELVRKEMPGLLEAKNYTANFLAAIKAGNSAASAGGETPAAFQQRQLNSAVGAYVLLRHELTAYAKQSYTSIGRGLKQEEKPVVKNAPPTFAENAPQVFELLKKAVDSIDAPPSAGPLAERKRKLSEALLILSTAGDKQIPAEQSNKLWKAVNEWAAGGKPSAFVADVHTDLNSGQVLQIGTGYPQPIEIKIKDMTAEAVIFSTYEFRRSIKERLTDENWRQLLLQPDNKMLFLFGSASKN